MCRVFFASYFRLLRTIAAAAMTAMMTTAAIPTYNTVLSPPPGPTGSEGDGVTGCVGVGVGVTPVGGSVGVGTTVTDGAGAAGPTLK